MITFQFHKGTIRTIVSLSPISPITYFNSIKVRLELLSQLTAAIIRKFQFHKGTIRTIYEKVNGEYILNFNSIKVRLEPIKSKI